MGVASLTLIPITMPVARRLPRTKTGARQSQNRFSRRPRKKFTDKMFSLAKKLAEVIEEHRQRVHDR